MASQVSLMKFSPDGEFFATAGQVSQAFTGISNSLSQAQH